MNAELFSIGTELLMGELTDTNAAWIAGRLPPLGIQLRWVSIVGDDLGNLSEAFSRGLQRSDILITTGGLGPTQDDLTREGVAAALGETPSVQDEALKELEQNFQSRGMSMPSHNIKQALLIPSSQFIPNPNGTAPGWWAQRDGKIIISMPGPPAEMHPMWDAQVEPRLREIVHDEVTLTRNIKTMGMSEGAIDELISEFFGRQNPYLGIYSKADGIHLRIIARARDISAAQLMVDPIEEAIVDRLGPYIWGYDDDTPEQSLGRSLKERGLTLATMESSTGGYLANTITDVPDSTVYFKGGVVAYSDAAKTAYGVPAETIRQHGGVSQETATAMARTIAQTMGADFGIGITGVAGPWEQEGKPVGLMYVAIAGPAGEQELQLRVPPRRITIKQRVSNTALIELNRLVNGVGKPYS